MVLVDTNILVDIATDDARWAEWSQRQLDAAAVHNRLAINGVIYAELSIRYEGIEDVESALRAFGVVVVDIPRSAFFVAGKAFLEYRRRSGVKSGVLPDFFIGAHAAVERIPLITRDAARYRSYFPSLELIAPGG